MYLNWWPAYFDVGYENIMITLRLQKWGRATYALHILLDSTQMVVYLLVTVNGGSCTGVQDVLMQSMMDMMADMMEDA